MQAFFGKQWVRYNGGQSVWEIRKNEKKGGDVCGILSE